MLQSCLFRWKCKKNAKSKISIKWLPQLYEKVQFAKITITNLVTLALELQIFFIKDSAYREKHKLVNVDIGLFSGFLGTDKVTGKVLIKNDCRK
jgi:hypothetical protein